MNVGIVAVDLGNAVYKVALRYGHNLIDECILRGLLDLI